MSNLRDAAIGRLCRMAAAPLALTSRGRILPERPGAVLVLKPCCLGDVLMATAVVGELRKRYPYARLGFAVGSWSREALENHPALDEVVDCGRVGNRARFGIGNYLALVRRLRKGSYDACFVLDRSPLLTLLPFLAGIRHRVGIDSAGRGFSLTVKTPWDVTKHETELYLDTLRASGWEPQGPRTLFVPAAADRALAAKCCSPLGSGDVMTKTIAIHAGGGVNPGMTLIAKRWFPDRLAALIKRFLARGDAVLLVGGPSDLPATRAVLESLGEDYGSAGRLLDLTGQTTFGQLGAVLERCQLFVGNDSGPTHLAVAVGTPALALFGPTTPRMYGPGRGGVAIYRQVECSPCFVNGRYDDTCRDFRCLAAITVEDVWQEAATILCGSEGTCDAVS